MSKAGHYLSQAAVCDLHAAATEKEIAALWRSIGDQYLFLAAREQRGGDLSQLWMDRSPAAE